MIGLPPFVIFSYCIGVALGIGASTIGGIVFLRALHDRKIDAATFSFIEIACNLAWVGLFVAVSAGIGMLVVMRFYTIGTPLVHRPQFFISAFAALVIFIDSIIVRAKIMPLIKQIIQKPFVSRHAQKNLSLFTTGGIVSLVSWYALFAFGIWGKAEISFTALFWLYVAITLASVFAAHMMEKIVSDNS